MTKLDRTNATNESGEKDLQLIRKMSLLINDLEEKNEQLNKLLDEIEAMGCLYKNNFKNCPGCVIAIFRGENRVCLIHWCR